MRRRFSVMALVASILTIIVIILLFSKDSISTYKSWGDAAIQLVLAILELFGIIFLLVILHAYFYTHRSRHFTFEGFDNESELPKLANMPINMTKLAREELTKQFRIIYEELTLCITRYEKNDYSYNDESMMIQNYKHEATEYKRAELMGYFYTFGEQKHELSIKSINSAIDQIIKISSNRNVEGYPLQKMIEDASHIFRPLTKFIDALVPPNTVRAVASLQWQGVSAATHIQSPPTEHKDPFSLHGPAGITLELEDLSQKQRSTIHTLWQPTYKETNPQSTDDYKEDALRCYRKLLPPIMRWLVLLFWESHLLENHITIKKSIFHKKYAEFFFILGILYLYSADQFTDYKNFFRQHALKHLRQATQINPKWLLPKERSGLVYAFLAGETQEGEEEKKDRWVKAGLEILDAALKQALEAEEEQDIQNHIKSIQLYLKFSGDSRHCHEAKIELETWVKSHSPEQFDSTPELGGTYPYNLACCYAKFAQKDPDKRSAQRYLAYSLARSQHRWLYVDYDPDLQLIRKDRLGFKKLKQELKNLQENEKKIGLPDEDKLSYMQGEAFKQTIDIILAKCGWV